MGFTAISIDNYVKKHLRDDKSADEKELRRSLNAALENYRKGAKCHCGNDIWVIGSAFAGNSCFTCITGEGYPDNDYEIDLAIAKSENRKGQIHIDDMDITQIHGFFSDDGFQINTDLIKKPSLCLTCVHDYDPNEEILCNMTRYDQKDDNEFICFAYKNSKG